jgi:hypothetical protein
MTLHELILELTIEGLPYNTLIGLIMDNGVSRADAERAIAELLASGSLVRRGDMIIH